MRTRRRTRKRRMVSPSLLSFHPITNHPAFVSWIDNLAFCLRHDDAMLVYRGLPHTT
jgi:hypothetical protein